MNVHTVSRPICIIGLGLIGGSLLRDLHAAGHPVFGYNRTTSRAEEAREEGFDVSSSLTETLARAEKEGALIVIAVPVPGFPTILDRIANEAPSCGFTDVASVKSAILTAVKERGLAGRYVGSHPMAGTADSGWKASKSGLFKGGAWVICYDQLEAGEVDDSWAALWADVAHMAGLVGAEVIPTLADSHDAAVARISHLPHVLAEALSVVGDNGGALALSLAAGSYTDATRVAGSKASLVRAMCETNAPKLVEALDEALELLTQARNDLSGDQPSIEELVDAGYRSRIRFGARSGLRPVLRLHPGADGWLSILHQAEAIGSRVEVF